MTLKYDKNTKLIGGFSIDIVDETDPVWSYMLRHNMLDENIDWVTEDVITDLLEKSKVKLPKFVAEYIEGCKRSGWHLQKVLSRLDDDEKVGDWAYDENDDLIPEKVDMIARAWLFGYEVEKEKKYKVRIKDELVLNRRLVKNPIANIFEFVIGDHSDIEIFTKQELIEAGFGGVFDNEMFEVEEVHEVHSER